MLHALRARALFAPDTGGGGSAPTLSITGSVGAGGVNRSQDVLAVKARLRELGFQGVDSNAGLIQAIKLVQSIAKGQQTLGGDGRIDVGGATLAWLNAANAPGWLRMPIGSRDGGFYNYGRVDQPNDPHQWGTSWLAETIEAAGAKYLADHRSLDPAHRCPILVNDTTKPFGGDTPVHAGHETGMSADLRLPNVDGAFDRGTTWQSRDYDRNAARAMLKAFKAQELFSRAFFNDPRLIDEGLCKHAGGHDNHMHVEIKAPAREA